MRAQTSDAQPIAAPSRGATSPLAPGAHFSVPLGVAIGLAVFTAAALAGTILQPSLDIPLVQTINTLSAHSVLPDRLARALTVNQLPQGILLMALLWYLWFATEDVVQRGQLAAGVAASACAGVASRALQLLLPTHLRPLHTTNLGFVLPAGVDPHALSHFNAFPSDHGAVFFGLAFVVWRARPRLGAVAFLCATVVDAARVYEGYHWPSDIVGAFGLALLVTSLFRADWIQAQASRVAAWEPAHRPLFYLLAFLVTYQIATLFDDAREIGHEFAYMMLHHDPFAVR